MLRTSLPDVQLLDLDGNTVSLQSFVKENTLIFMWASW